MILTLDSVSDSLATTGVLQAGQETFHTIELPWDNNLPDRSCVPAGTYELVPYESPVHGATWRLHNPDLMVWGFSTLAPKGCRTEIEIHTGNWARQSLGCILIGLQAGILEGEEAVISSVEALARLRDLIDNAEDNQLTITRTLP